MSEVTAPSPSDSERRRALLRYHGIAFLLAITGWGAADAWAENSDLMLASVIAVVNAVVAGYVLSTLLHEWGHFIGARISGAYSPMVRKPDGVFIFGFNFDRNSREQFISMSLGGIIGTWSLVLLVLVFVPLDSPGRVALFAVALAHGISVLVFEGPVVARAMRGEAPQASLDLGLANGSRDRGKVWGYGAGGLIWLLAI